jgi:hypothetical protein
LLNLASPADEHVYGAAALVDFKKDPVVIVCARCNRRDQYEKPPLLERYGPAIVGPDVLRKIAIRDRRESMNSPARSALRMSGGRRLGIWLTPNWIVSAEHLRVDPGTLNA